MLKFAALFVSTGVCAQTTEQKERYKIFADKMMILGDEYVWEPYTAESEDGWFLTLFRVTSRTRYDNADGRMPILCQHGALGDSMGWVEAGGDP